MMNINNIENNNKTSKKIKNKREENKTIFTKIYDYFNDIDKKIFGLSSEEIIKKYKNEIVLFIIVILILLVLLFCFNDTNLKKQRGGNPLIAAGASAIASDPQGAMDVAKSSSKMSENMNSDDDKSSKDSDGSDGKKKKSFGAIKNANKTMKAMKTPFKKAGNYLGGTLDRNKEYVRKLIYDALMFIIIFIVFIPSLSFIIIIFLSFRVLKPKIKYIKSL